MSRNSQMEIMGFVMFFVLLILGIFFMIALTVREKPPTYERFESFSLQKIENAFLISILDVTTSCDNLTLKEVVDDCVFSNLTHKDPRDCNDGLTSCDVAKETLMELLNISFKDFGLTYYLEVRSTQGEKQIFNVSIEGCNPNTSEIAPSLQPLVGPKYINYMMLLYLCKK